VTGKRAARNAGRRAPFTARVSIGVHRPAARRTDLDGRGAQPDRRVLVPQATGGYPFQQEHSHLVTHFDVYANELLSQEVVRGRIGRRPRSASRRPRPRCSWSSTGDDAVQVIVDGLSAG
jgi:hypothetical protein